MSTEQVHNIARIAAKQLEKDGETGVRLSVEQAIVAEDSKQLADPIAIAGLIISLSSLALTIFKDIRAFKKEKKENNQLRTDLEKSIQEELDELEGYSDLPEERRRKLLNAVVEATLTEY